MPPSAFPFDAEPAPPPGPPFRPFTPRQIALCIGVFALVVYASNRAVYALHAVTPFFDGPRYWPLSVFTRRLPTPFEALLAVLVWIAGLLAIRAASQSGYRWGAARFGVVAFALCVGSNAIQGAEHGFITPLAGGTASPPAANLRLLLRRDTDAGGRGIQYWRDAQGVSSASSFLRAFNTVQPTLREHARTHPPGATLAFYVLRRLTGDRPALASALLALTAMLISAWGMRRLATATTPRSPNGAASPPDAFAVPLFLLLPAVQIYFCATLDALICGLLLVAIAAFAETANADRDAPNTTAPLWSARPAVHTLLAAAALGTALFLTFGALWAAGPLALCAVAPPRPVRALARLALVGALAVAPLFALRAGFGFDYITAFKTASQLENPHGFRLVAEPLSYLVTRLEDIAEIAVFFGPFLLLLARRGLPALLRNRRAFALVAGGVGTLALLFLSGAYRTGETARACLFLYPLLLLPVLSAATTSAAKRQALALVWTQTLLMQTFGWYFW